MTNMYDHHKCLILAIYVLSCPEIEKPRAPWLKLPTPPPFFFTQKNILLCIHAYNLPQIVE